MEDIQLNYTPNIADGLLRASQVKQHLRDNACGVTHVQERKIGEEEIHGDVESGICLGYHYNCDVSHHGHGVCDQKNDE
jgi:hypothetical protein